jgi:hypothetical protein
MTGTTSVDKTEKIGITLPKSILQKIEQVRRGYTKMHAHS